ncbi:MAG: amidohydrolase family protein, partial [Candidatus Dormibacteraeota bacterium]|nr:amidohydrolase family protein [Candidatus Dormibacteraeota bacterium]
MAPIVAPNRPTLFAGCQPEVAAGPDGRILAVGPGARSAAGRGATVHRLRGTALPGLHDAHLHLEHMATARLSLELGGSRSQADAVERVRKRDRTLPDDAWLIGRGWNNDLWRDPTFPNRHDLDSVTSRPVLLRRVDGHSAWASSAALRAGGIGRGTADPPGGVIDREASGEPAGILRETAVQLLERAVPEVGDSRFDSALRHTLVALAHLGLTAVQTFDGGRSLGALARLRAAGRVPIRVTHHLPVADLVHAERLGVRSGFGDQRLRLWGVKAFLDGSLGSRTAQM